MTTKTEKTFKKITDKLNNAKKNQDGFSFIEVIIVIAMILILTAILIPSYMGFVETAREANVKISARNMYTAIQAANMSLDSLETSKELYLELKELNPALIAVGATYDETSKSLTESEIFTQNSDGTSSDLSEYADYGVLTENTCAISDISFEFDNPGFTFDYYQYLNNKLYCVRFINGNIESVESYEIKDSENNTEDSSGDEFGF